MLTQKNMKRKRNSYQKMKRSLDERHIQTHGSLTETFRTSQMSFSTRREFLLIEKDICDRRNVSVKLPCVAFIQRSLHFFGNSFLFLFLFFCVIHTSVLYFPRCYVSLSYFSFRILR